MDWNKIATEKLSTKSYLKMNIEGRSGFRSNAIRIAQHLHRDKLGTVTYPGLVIREYLRQLVGPEMFFELERVFTAPASKQNNRDIERFLRKLRLFALFNQQPGE